MVFLCEQIDFVVENLNLPKMNSAQVFVSAKLIMEDEACKNLKPEDLKLCFERGMKGEYGKLFGRLDVNILFEWINGYSADREEAIISHNRDRKVQYMAFPDIKEPLGAAFSEEVKDRFRKIGSLPVASKRTVRERTILDDLHDEFDALVKAQDARRVPGPVFVEYNGHLYDRQEFINLRFEESQSDV